MGAPDEMVKRGALNHLLVNVIQRWLNPINATINYKLNLCSTFQNCTDPINPKVFQVPDVQIVVIVFISSLLSSN